MKKLFFTIFLIGIIIQLNAQVTPPGNVQTKKQVKTISPTKSLVIRNDLSRLNLQSTHLCDSISMIQKQIADIMNELYSEGAQPETIKAWVVEERMAQLSKSVELINALTKKMHEMAKSIIQNMKG